MKRITALILSMLLVIAMLAGCGKKDSDDTQSGDGGKESNPSTQQSVQGSEQENEEPAEKTYDEHMTITAVTSYSFTNAVAGAEYGDNDWYKWITEKFNVEFDLWACSQNEAATLIPLWINNGAMPDFVVPRLAWSLPAYYNYVDQGLIRALPDDLKEKWPNLGRLMDASGMEDLLTVDGKIYALPANNYLNFAPELAQGATPTFWTYYFRKDWAEQVGMTDFGDDYTITMSELHEYLTKVKAAGLSEAPMSATQANTIRIFYGGLGVSERQWQETKDGFVWTPAEDNYIDMLVEMQKWWNEGLLDPDFITTNSVDETFSKLLNGQAAVTVYSGGNGEIEKLDERFASVGIENAMGTVCGVAVLTDENGKSHMTGEFNGAGYPTMFRPDLDDATMERILDIIDYLCTPEGELSVYYGIPGVQWEFAEDGSIVKLVEDNVEVGTQLFELGMVGIRFDDYNVSKYCSVPLKYVEMAQKMNEIRRDGDIWVVPANYERFQSESKSNYSVPVQKTIVNTVCNSTDVAATWKNFVEEYRGIWEPLLKDLNAYYYGK